MVDPTSATRVLDKLSRRGFLTRTTRTALGAAVGAGIAARAAAQPDRPGRRPKMEPVSEHEMMEAMERIEERLAAGEEVSGLDLLGYLQTVAATNEAGGEPAPGIGREFLQESVSFKRVDTRVADAMNVSVLEWTVTPLEHKSGKKKHRWSKVIF